MVSYNDGLSDDTWAMLYFLTKKSPFFPNLCSQALEERTFRNFLNVPKIKRINAFTTNSSKTMMHRDEEHLYQNQTDGVAGPRKWYEILICYS
jgi:hypothetical protein